MEKSTTTKKIAKIFFKGLACTLLLSFNLLNASTDPNGLDQPSHSPLTSSTENFQKGNNSQVTGTQHSPTQADASGEKSKLSWLAEKMRNFLKATSPEKMSAWYYIIFLLLFFAFLLGYRTGFCTQLILLFSALITPLALHYFHTPIMKFLGALGINATSQLPRTSITLILLAIVSYLTMRVRQLCKFLLRILFLKGLDAIIGGMIGLLLGCIGLGSLIILLENTPLLIPSDLPMKKELTYLASQALSQETLDNLANIGVQIKNSLNELLEILKKAKQ